MLESVDRDLFLFLNGLHSSFMDPVMYWISYKYTWFPLYLFFIFLFIRFYGKKGIVLTVVAFVLIAVVDATTTYMFKEVVQRLRPCHDPELGSMVHLVRDHCGGKYGFFSGHASNSFAIAVLTGLILRRHFPPALWLLLIWAAVISYSRVYLGVHFPGDILAGAAWGTLWGYVFFSAAEKLKLLQPAINQGTNSP